MTSLRSHAVSTIIKSESWDRLLVVPIPSIIDQETFDLNVHHRQAFCDASRTFRESLRLKNSDHLALNVSASNIVPFFLFYTRQSSPPRLFTGLKADFCRLCWAADLCRCLIQDSRLTCVAWCLVHDLLLAPPTPNHLWD